MLVITTAEGLAHALVNPPDGLAPILHRYQPLMLEAEIATLFILQPGDRAGDLEQLRGRPFAFWEFILLASGWYEAVFVLSDDGFGHVVLIPDIIGIDPTLLEVCRQNAEA